MKRLTLQMTLVFAFVISLALVSDSLATTRYVNGQTGNDTWDGLSPTYVSGTKGPKETINAAIYVSNATGDEIVVDYADGFIYHEANAANVPNVGDNNAVQKGKQITFSSSGAEVPTVKNWTIWANTTFSGPFYLSEGLILANGQVTGGDKLTMLNGTTVTRTLGSIVTGQLAFAAGAKVNYLYNTGADVTTGLEMPPTSRTDVINNLLTANNPTTLTTTHLHLNEDKTMNGMMDLVDSGAIFNLEGNTLTLVSTSDIVHDNDSDIINGELVFELNGYNVVLNRTTRDLPNITTNGSGNLQIKTNGKIEVLTANGTTTMTLEAAGSTSKPIGGIVNNSTGLLTGSTIELKRNGNIYFDVTGSVIANQGSIFFSHANGSVGVVNLGNVVLNGGTIKFADSDSDGDHVVIRGNGDFFKGTWHQVVGAGFTDRRLWLTGSMYRFGMNGQNADFSSVDDGPVPVHLLVNPYGSTVEQTINGNKPGSIWHGTMQVYNTKATPAVIFTNGHLRVLDDITFSGGLVLVDNCILSIGNEIAPIGNGNFINTGGFTSFKNGVDTGGRIAMNGNNLQQVSGTGAFGSFEVKNTSNPANLDRGVRIITNDITCRELFYLTTGFVDNDLTRPGRRNVKFSGPVDAPPHIVKTNGSFRSKPNFVSWVDVEYQGNEKDYLDDPDTDPTKIVYELPSEINGDPTGIKLRDLLIKTQNNTICANGHGWVRVNHNIAVNGRLVIDAGQTLIINDSRTLTLNSGGTFDIQGYLFTAQDATIALGAPGGFSITSASYLPSIRIKAGSQNNRLTARGLRVATMSEPVDPFFCPDFDASLAGLATGMPGNITFDANGAGQHSSLAVNFTDTDHDHIANLTTAPGATLTLLNNLYQYEVNPSLPTALTHTHDAVIDIADFTYKTKSNTVNIEGGSTTTSSAAGLLWFNGWTQNINMTAYSGQHPTIAANVKVDMQASTLALVNGSSDSLTITQNFELKKGDVDLGVTPTVTVQGENQPKMATISAITLGSKLTLTGKNFILHQGGNVIGSGILYLNASNPPMHWTIHQSPQISNLWIQNDVDLFGDGYSVTITSSYVHQNGVVNLNSTNLIIGQLATYTRLNGTYDATTGWLWLDSPNFNVGAGTFEIPNFRIHTRAATVVGGTAVYTIEKRLDIYPGDNYQFTHNGNMHVLDGVTVRYHSGRFDVSPVYQGSIRLITVNNFSRVMPTTVWPPNMPNLVSDLQVLTWTNDPDRFLSPAGTSPADTNAVNRPTTMTLQQNYQINRSLLLRNGALVVDNGKTLTFAQDLAITRVDGGIQLNGSAKVNSSAGGYAVTYENNGNQDIFENPALVVPPNDRPDANQFGPYVVTGHELPEFVETLTFTRHRDILNYFTVIDQPVTVTGATTLNIRNNVYVTANARLTVLGHVYILNESATFPLATDPLCWFNSPLRFAGDLSPQMVYVPKDGVDIRPPFFGPALPPPPPGPARIELFKDNPTDKVCISGGDLIVDHITFVNGLLCTEDDNSITIPAPPRGNGQGFDRSGVVAGNVSHVIGRVSKQLKNREVDAWSSDERQEFPVGSLDKYRPMAFTFKNKIGQVTIPHNLIITAQHIDTPPRGDQGIPIADNCGVTTNTYTPFFWYVETEGTYTQEEFDLELTAAGLKRDENPADGIDGYHNVADLRILRRHGTITEVDNAWLMQGACADYDNAQYTEGPTVINEYSKGGLRSDGAIFTVGLPYGDLPVAKHFADKVVWDGNPYNAMTFYVTRAEYYSGKPLQPGDEIGIYDGQYCVGYVKLAKQVTPDNYAIVVASKDDDPNDGVVNGYTDGNKIYFRYWDSKTDTEYMVPDESVKYYKVGTNEPEVDVVFEQRSARVELFKGEPRVSGQEIWLTKGWNIFSLAVDPNPPINLFDTTTPNIFGGGILNPIEPQLLKVQDESGNTIEVILGNWGNNIGDWQMTEGYYIKVNQDVLLQVQSNTPLTTPLSIPLGVGWNIISYPCLESQQNAIDVLQELIANDKLDKAMDQYGHALEKLAFVTENNGWYNGIGAMQAGHGYYIKLKQPAVLNISCAGQDGLPKQMAAQEIATPKHFARERGNPYMPMNIYINDVRLDGQALVVGDEVAVYDGGLLVGSVVVQHELTKEKPLSLIAGMDDGSGNGFTKGNSITFKVWKADLNQEVEIDMADVRHLENGTGSESGSQAFEPRATTTVTIDSKTQVQVVPETFELGQNYPNPFNPSTMITFALPDEASVTVQVFDITGKLVTTLVDTRMTAGYHNVEWTGTDASGQRVATGIYFYKMTAGNFVQTKKMLFAK